MERRKIKFRVWDGKAMSDKVVFRNDPEVASGVSVYDLNGFFSELSKKGYVFMQLTDLPEKNGREIYEGDIVATDYQLEAGVIRLVGEMVYNKNLGQFGVQLWTSLEEVPSRIVSKDLPEVLGNIYEDKDLYESLKLH